MYALAIDLAVHETEQYHPQGITRAYADLDVTLETYGFKRIQSSLYVTQSEEMSNLFLAIQKLREQDWFPKSVRDIRAFKIDQWSDFTSMVKKGSL